MSKIVAIVNQKGGVGKTTSAVNLAAAVAAKGKKVLLVDIDAQGNATSGFGINKKETALSTYDLLINKTSAEEIIVKKIKSHDYDAWFQRHSMKNCNG